MYLKFYGLREEPFGVTPDPRFLYLSPSYREAQATLEYGIRSGRGFTALIARPGMGKTTLLFHLLEKYSRVARTAFIFLTQCDSREFMRYLMSELGADTRETDFVRLQDQFGQLLVRESQAGKKVIAVVDEAQNLDLSVLETVRLLSDFETPRSKLLHIILTGQPELADKLASPSLLQLRQRISHLVRLDPLSEAEVRQFIEYRLRVAGYMGAPLFTPEALDLIVQRSLGIPRTVNNLCFNALSLGCALGRRSIDAAILSEVSADLDFEAIARDQNAPPRVALDREAAAQFHARNDGVPAEAAAANPLPAGEPSVPLAEVGADAPAAVEAPASHEIQPPAPGPMLVPDLQPLPAIACQDQAATPELGNLALQVQPVDPPAGDGAPPAVAPPNGSGAPAQPLNGSATASGNEEKKKSAVDVEALASDCALLGMDAPRRWKRAVTNPAATVKPPAPPPPPRPLKPSALRRVPPRPAAAPGNGAPARLQRAAPVQPGNRIAAPVGATRMQPAAAARTMPARRRHSQRSLYLAAAASGLLLLLLVWLLGASSPSPAPSDAGSGAAVNAPGGAQPDAAASDADANAAAADSTVLDVVEELPRPGEENSARDSRPAVVMRGTRKGEQLLRRVDPVYPAAARLNRIQGPVVLEASIGIHGFLRHIRVLSGDPLLADSVLDAVKGWQYQTRTSGSRRGETPTRIVVNFQLVTRDTAQKR